MREPLGRIGILWRDDPATWEHPILPTRLAPVADGLTAQGIEVELVVWADTLADNVRARLSRLDGVLVWVDPIGGGEDRSILDPLLVEVEASGVWVSAHPDTIQRIGTKEVLYRTRHLSWGTDTHLYPTFEQFIEELPARLQAGTPRVLKQNRGNGGIGVWKVQPLPQSSYATDELVVRVQHAAPQDATTEDMPLPQFLQRCESYFQHRGQLVDQPFLPRISEGMIRAYLAGTTVVGFARQQPADPRQQPNAPTPDQVLGLPSTKTMAGPDDPLYADLRSQLEREWIPGLVTAVGLETLRVPLLWDADFLLGSAAPDGVDT